MNSRRLRDVGMGGILLAIGSVCVFPPPDAMDRSIQLALRFC